MILELGKLYRVAVSRYTVFLNQDFSIPFALKKGDVFLVLNKLPMSSLGDTIFDQFTKIFIFKNGKAGFFFTHSEWGAMFELIEI